MLLTSQEKFLIDSSSLMSASRLYYSYDILPSFWNVLDAEIKAGRVVLLDLVLDEINKGQDFLKNWISERIKDFNILNHINDEIITKYTQVIQYIQTCEYYNDKGLESWADSGVADPWLIASSAVTGYMLVTAEQSVGTLSKKNKTGSVKIPDVARQFNVETNSLFDMMRNLSISI